MQDLTTMVHEKQCLQMCYCYLCGFASQSLFCPCLVCCSICSSPRFALNSNYYLLFAGSENTQAPIMVIPREIDGVPKFSLTVFGMASYKLKGSMWIQNGISECHLANSLMQAADNWLRLLQVTHPDFQFFASHGTCCR